MAATVDFTKAGWIIAGADAPGGVSKTATQITVSNQTPGDNVYLYKDYGAGFWGDFTFQFEYQVTADITVGSTNETAILLYCGNTLGDFADCNTTNGVLLQHSDFGANGTIYRHYIDNRPQSGGSSDLGLNFDRANRYYFTITRDTSIHRVNILVKTDSHEGTVIANVTKIGTSSPSFRYLIMYGTRGTVTGGPNNFNVFNLDDGVSDDFASSGGIRGRAGGSIRVRGR